MELVEGEVGGGAAEREAGALGGEDGVVEVALGGGEGAGDGPGAGYVGDVVPELLRGWGISLWISERTRRWRRRDRRKGFCAEGGHTPPASTRTRSL